MKKIISFCAIFILLTSFVFAQTTVGGATRGSSGSTVTPPSGGEKEPTTTPTPPPTNNNQNNNNQGNNNSGNSGNQGNNGNQGNPNNPNNPSSGFYTLTVLCNIQGAEVTVYNNKTRIEGRTPFSVNLKKGSYFVLVKYPGHGADNQKVVLDYNKTVSVILKKELANVWFSSNLSDSDIYIYQQNRLIYSGKFKVNLQLDAGQYRIVISRNGYLTIDKTINVSYGGSNNFSYTLQPLNGTVEVLLQNMQGSSNQPIYIYINGQPTNGYVFQLAPGVYKFDVVSGAFVLTRTITVNAGQVYRLKPVFDLQLEQNY